MKEWFKNFFLAHWKAALASAVGSLAIFICCWILKPYTEIVVRKWIETAAVKYVDERFAQKMNDEAKKALTEQLELDWVRDKVLNRLREDIIGFSYSAYFFLGTKGEISHTIPIYISKNIKSATLFMEVKNDKENSRGKVEFKILFDSIKIDTDFIVDINQTLPFNIDLTQYIGRVRKNPVYSFDGNVHTITIITKSGNRPSNATVSIKALINTDGLAIRAGR